MVYQSITIFREKSPSTSSPSAPSARLALHLQGGPSAGHVALHDALNRRIHAIDVHLHHLVALTELG